MFMNGFAGLYTENLFVHPFVRLGGRTDLLTRTSQGSRLEVILIDLEVHGALWDWLVDGMEGENTREYDYLRGRIGQC